MTGLLRDTGSDGRRGGLQHRAVEAWHVQRRRALRSGAFDNIPPGSAQFQGGRGHLEALQCHGVDVVGRVSSLPGNLYVVVNEGQKCFCHLRLGLGERHRGHQCRWIFENYLFFLKI